MVIFYSYVKMPESKLCIALEFTKAYILGVASNSN